MPIFYQLEQSNYGVPEGTSYIDGVAGIFCPPYGKLCTNFSSESALL